MDRWNTILGYSLITSLSLPTTLLSRPAHRLDRWGAKPRGHIVYAVMNSTLFFGFCCCKTHKQTSNEQAGVHEDIIQASGQMGKERTEQTNKGYAGTRVNR